MTVFAAGPSLEAVQLGRYRLLKLLATGGMGEVFLARQEGPAGFTKTMVVKRMLAHLGRAPSFVEMFLNEARLAARLSHPNIVQIFELGEQNGAYFMAMEFIHGVNLRSIKHHMDERQVEVPAELAAWICAQALKGLHYAHTLTDENGAALHIVHRDVSPDNVIVDFNATVKMVDFGIAKASTSVPTTDAGAVKGKFAYMAPELLNGQKATPRTDVYAMGIVLYEFLTGGRPFQGTSEGALIKSILEDAPRPLRDLRPGIPEELEEILHRAISKNPQERFRTAESMSSALEGFALGSGGMAQEGVKELLRGLFGDETEIISPVASPPSSRSSSTPFNPLTGGGSAIVSLDEKAASLLEMVPATEAPPSPSARGPRLARPWLWAGAGTAIMVAAVGLTQQARMSADVLASALVRPAAVAVAQAATTAPTVPATVSEPVAASAPEPTRSKSGAKMPDRGTPAASTVKRVARQVPKGTVVLRVAPRTEVIHAGKTLGVTPMAPIQLPSGARTLTLVNRGLNVEKKIRVVVPERRKVVLRINLLSRK